jgi:3-oxoadipate enol-lactonase
MLAATCLALVLPSAARAADASPQTLWVKANGTHLRYVMSGTGPKTIVMIHEMSMTLESWDYILPALQPGRRILRYDMRGFGLSEKIHGDTLTMNDEVEDLRALLDTLKITGPVTLIGGAVGADVALNFAVKYPERVTAVLTISAAINLHPNPNPPPRAERARPADPYEVPYPATLRTDKAKFDRFVAIQVANDQHSFDVTSRMVATFDFSDVLPKVKPPALVIGTSLFPARTMEMMDSIAKAMPNGTFVALKTGHYASWETPELVAPVVLDYLKKVGG